MSNLVLYRKYRPKNFEEIAGQEHIVKTLTNALSMDKIAHAYLFTGPRGTGKTTIARLLAKAINCENRKGYQSCDKCSACEEIDKGKSMDLIEVDAASNRGIDEIRELRDGIQFSPTKLKYKVFVVDECLTGEHIIYMADGTVKNISEIKNNEKIASIDLRTGKIVSRPVKNWFERRTNKIVRIKTSSASLKCTLNHRLWVMRDSEMLLTESKNIQTSDFLLSPLFLPHIQKNNLTPAQLSLLALIQCDGHISKDSVTIQVEISKDKDYFQKVFTEGLKAWKIKKRPVITKTARKTRLLRVYSKELKEIFIKLNCPAGNKSKEIDIPNAVFQAPLKSIMAYIDTCFCCEGNIDFNKSLCLYRLNFNSVSKIFVEKLRILLKKFGITGGVIEILKQGENNRNNSNMYRLHLSHYNLNLFYKKIGLSMKRKSNILTKCASLKVKQDTIPIEKIILRKRKEKKITYSRLASVGVYPGLSQHLSRRTVENFIKISKATELNKYLEFRYEKVKSVEIVNKKELVYDFTVEGTHTFIANGICSSNCHMLTREAFNALLKTLEEPPAHAIFILATTEMHKIPQTIASRCQKFDFYKLSLEKIIERLSWISQQEKVAIEKEALELIALNADGAMRDGESLLGQIMSMEDNKITLKEVQEILGVVDIRSVQSLANFLAEKKNSEAINHINTIFDQGYDPVQFTKSLINYLRKMMILKVDESLANLIAAELTKEQLGVITEQGAKFSQPDLIKTIRLFIQAENEIKSADFPQLPLELAIVECCEEENAGFPPSRE